MKWFKHDSDAHGDAKLEKLRIRYGMEGYGLYWYCLELVARGVSHTNLTFELEHDAEVIAHRTGLHYEHVQEMMTYMVDLGLFDNNQGVITCRKMLQRLDQSMVSNPEMRKAIAQVKQNHDSVMTLPDSVMREEKRRDKKRTEQKRGNARKRAPQDFTVSAEMYVWADDELGMSAERVQQETRAFLDHEFAHARKDWAAVWRNWLRRAAKWEKSNPGRKMSYAEKLAEDLKRASNE